MNKINFKKILPHIAAFAVIMVAMTIYFWPAVSCKFIPRGSPCKVLNQQDVRQWKGAYQEIAQYKEKNPGANPQWTNSMFSGMPAYQIGIEYPNNYTRFITPVIALGLPNPMHLVFLLFAGFYVLLLSFRINPWLCIAGALAFTFSSFNFINIEAGHDTKGLAIAYAPLVLAGINLAFRGHLLKGAAVTTLALALELYANHLQITYYLAIAVLIWAIVEGIYAIRQDRLKGFIRSSLVLLGAAIIAVGVNITNLLVTEEYGKETMRGKTELTKNKEDQTGGLEKSYALKWSNGVTEPFTMLIPNFHGGASVGELSTRSEVYKYLKTAGQPQAKEYIKQMYTYWGDQQFTSGPIYFGALICFLFVLGLFIVKGPVKWWIAISVVLFVFLSMGKNFPFLTDLFFNYFPLYNKFRSVTFLMVIAQILFPLMGILAVDRIINWSGDRETLKKPLLYSFYIVGGLCLIFALIPGLFFDFRPSEFTDNMADEQLKGNWPEELMAALRSDRESLMKMDAWRSLLFITLGFGLIWLYIKKSYRAVYLMLAVGILALADLWMVDKRYLNNDDFKPKTAQGDFTPTPADNLILKDREIFRVLNLRRSDNPFADARTSYFHRSIGGYHGAKLKRYQELKDYRIDNEFDMFGKSGLSDSALKAAHGLNMLNTRYFILGDEENAVLRNPHALGNAWFVKDYLMVENADAEIDSLARINPAETAIIDKRFAGQLDGFKPEFDPTATIKLLESTPEYVSYQSESKTPQLATFSEIYYEPGWNAYIDGTEVPYFRCNYVLRGMKVPAGSHKIEFRYEAPTFDMGEKIALGSSILMFALLAYALFMAVSGGFLKKTADKAEKAGKA
jgi:hypothetical protein